MVGVFFMLLWIFNLILKIYVFLRFSGCFQTCGSLKQDHREQFKFCENWPQSLLGEKTGPWGEANGRAARSSQDIPLLSLFIANSFSSLRGNHYDHSAADRLLSYSTVYNRDVNDLAPFTFSRLSCIQHRKMIRLFMNRYGRAVFLNDRTRAGAWGSAH